MPSEKVNARQKIGEKWRERLTFRRVGMHRTGAERQEPADLYCRFSTMAQDKLYDEATVVTAEHGEVILDGPDGVDVKITPQAAEDTADNLIEGSMKARGQRRLNRTSPRSE